MKIDWASLGIVSAVSLAAGVVVVALFSLALVGLSARAPERVGGPQDGARPVAMSPAAGTTVAVVCIAACIAIVLYGLYIIAF
jgi:hypothetical protein